MSESEVLGVAESGDVLVGTDLQAGIDQLLAMADGLNPFLASVPSVDNAQEIGRVQQQLRSLASSLTDAQIDLLAGQVKITAAHINAAVAYTDGVIAQIADWRKRIDKIGALIDFFAVVLTGKGADILKAAGKLKSAIDA